MCGECVSCPFADNESSNFLEGCGCLPSPFEIYKMKELSGNNWACHANPDKMCAGFAASVKTENQFRENKINIKTGKLINMKSIHGLDKNLDGIPESLRY